MRTLIVANGELNINLESLANVASFDQIIAVDGGLLHCRALGLKPDLLIGDLDSLPTAELALIKRSDTEVITFPPEKDEIDLELALLHAIDLGAMEIVILAGLGGRVDMSLANLALLAHPKFQDVDIEFWHDEQRIWLIQAPGGRIRGKVGDTVSLLPFQGDAHGIHTTSLAYPLKDESLSFGPGRGVSNVLTADDASVSLSKGALLVVWTPGRA